MVTLSQTFLHASGCGGLVGRASAYEYKSKDDFPKWKASIKNFIMVIRYNSVRANQELVGIHNDAAHEELVKIYNRPTSRKS